VKLSLNWIKEYVKIPADMNISRLVYDLTMSTVEIESVVELSKKFDNMIIGVINEVLPHPNADKLKICKVDIGRNKIQEIVCGANNLSKKMKVVVALPGATVCWHGEGSPVKIGITKIRGIYSYGMICASSEIGLLDLFPFVGNAEILDLSKFDIHAGLPVSEALNLEDIILKIDNKSLTNRPDLWGHYGIAREISAIYGFPLVDFVPFVSSDIKNFSVKIDERSKCYRFIGVKLEGVKVKSSPFEIQSHIWRVGIRPINVLVDITNYVMLATGQPMHAFDSDNIKGRITVRNAYDSEKLLLLNGKKLSLSSKDLVASDDECVISLMGIMGGTKNSVLPTTKNVMLEIANFEAINIRRTAARYEIRTESATRFEKAIDPQRCDIALSLAMKMFKTLYPNINVTGFCDDYSKPLKKNKIVVSLSWLQKRLGKYISSAEMISKLERLGFAVKILDNDMHVVVPTWRSTGDVSIPEDVMEEIARMYGFENFESTPVVMSFDAAINQIEIDLERKIKEYFAFRCGMREIFTYPWMNNDYAAAVLQNNKNTILLSNPPSPEEYCVRSSLLPNLCKAIVSNLRYYNKFEIFESAKVVLDQNYKSLYDSKEFLPIEHKKIAGAMVGSSTNANLLFRRVKGMLEVLSKYVHVEPILFKKLAKPVWADKTIWLNLFCEKEMIGDFALLSRKVSIDCKIKNSAVVLFELDIDLLRPYKSRSNKFDRFYLREYPFVDYDISMLFDLSVKWDEIYNCIIKNNNLDSTLCDVFFVDEYRGKQIPDKKKSITIRLVIGSLKRTLISQEIEKKANSVIECLNNRFKAELRSAKY
jgi:phenylalanyl-tRNA synthetase beta chain